MFDEDLIQRWLDEGTIYGSQAAPVKKTNYAFSTIWTIFIGLGARLFVASNWEKIGDIIKVLLLEDAHWVYIMQIIT